MSSPFLINRLTIIGIGLIGGCLAHALRAANAVQHVVVCDSNPQALSDALALGVADSVETDPALAVINADMVVLCTPITAMGHIAALIKDHLAPDAVLTDVGGTKESVVNDIQHAFGYLPPFFVPGHPIAGTEKHGVQNAFAELFQQRRVVITPHIENERQAVERVIAMWQATGAQVEEMGIQHHDQVLAATSHLPHVLAFSTVDTLANLDDRAEVFRFAAGGFRDFTRIATSDPAMWADICLNNSKAVLSMMAAYQEKLTTISTAINQQDRATLFEIFRRAKHARDNFYKEP